jgi:hypothetical protein
VVVFVLALFIAVVVIVFVIHDGSCCWINSAP